MAPRKRRLKNWFTWTCGDCGWMNVSSKQDRMGKMATTDKDRAWQVYCRGPCHTDYTGDSETRKKRGAPKRLNITDWDIRPDGTSEAKRDTSNGRSGHYFEAWKGIGYGGRLAAAADAEAVNGW